MKKFTITKARFMQFFFESGQDSEIEQLKISLAEKAISQLQETGTSIITISDIFNNCNQASIQLCFLQEYEDTKEGELSQLNEEFQVILI